MVGLQTKPDSDIKAEHKVLTIALHIPVSPAVCLSLSYTNKTDTHAVGVEGTRAWYDHSLASHDSLYSPRNSQEEKARQRGRETETQRDGLHSSSHF